MAIINIYHQKNFVILTTIYHSIYYRYTHIYNNCNISLSSHFKKRTKEEKKKFIMASKDKIVIYGHQAARASRPYWLLREYGMKIGEDFLEVDTGGPVTGFNDVRDTEEFLKLNPYRLIPVMKHGDVVLYESQAICQYIANVLGGPMSAQNEGERARISMYGLSSISNFEPNLLPMVFGQGGKEGRVQFTKKLQPLLNALNTELEGRDYLIGEGRGRFTVADVMMASVVGQYGRAIKFDYSPWPNVLTWVNLTTKRPAFYPPRGMKVNPKGEAPKGKL